MLNRNSPHMKKFLIFDAYGTLVELDDFYGRLQRGFAAAGHELPLDVVTRAARLEMQHYMTHTVSARTQADWIALKHDCAGILAGAIKSQEEGFNLGGDRVLRLLEDALVFRIFPDVIQVLQTFHNSRVKMGVLSNWDFSLARILEEVGLAKYFSFILPSSEVGVQKPAREFFEHALQLAQRGEPNLQSSDCVYVGDHYDGDVVGARGAGMTPVWLVRSERDLASGEVRDDEVVLRIEDLRGLLSLAG